MQSVYGLLFYVALGIGLYVLYDTWARGRAMFGGGTLAGAPRPVQAHELAGSAQENFVGNASTNVPPTSFASAAGDGARDSSQHIDLLPPASGLAAWGTDGPVGAQNVLAGSFMDPGQLTGVNINTRVPHIPILDIRGAPPITTRWDLPVNQTPDLQPDPKRTMDMGPEQSFPVYPSYAPAPRA